MPVADVVVGSVIVDIGANQFKLPSSSRTPKIRVVEPQALDPLAVLCHGSVCDHICSNRVHPNHLKLPNPHDPIPEHPSNSQSNRSLQSSTRNLFEMPSSSSAMLTSSPSASSLPRDIPLLRYDDVSGGAVGHHHHSSSLHPKASPSASSVVSGSWRRASSSVCMSSDDEDEPDGGGAVHESDTGGDSLMWDMDVAGQSTNGNNSSSNLNPSNNSIPLLHPQPSLSPFVKFPSTPSSSSPYGLFTSNSAFSTPSYLRHSLASALPVAQPPAPVHLQSKPLEVLRADAMSTPASANVTTAPVYPGHEDDDRRVRWRG
ncbi:hypothetical protein BC829DRAFT_441979 [Chytridium lagenaria]|nr:hypothetical protein BC829DRAFT_441979 [Chytridium lagenaria]